MKLILIFQQIAAKSRKTKQRRMIEYTWGKISKQRTANLSDPKKIGEKIERSNLAGPGLDDNVTILADGAGLLWIGLGSSGIGLRLEVVLLVGHGWLWAEKERDRESDGNDQGRDEKRKRCEFGRSGYLYNRWKNELTESPSRFSVSHLIF